MGRLTKWYDGELLVNEEECLLNANGIITKDEMYKIMRHLAEKLAHYEDLEQQELLVKLPCKPNEIFFAILKGEIYELVFDNIRINTFLKDKITFVCHVKGKDWDTRYIDSKNKTYRTYEEAYKELKEL